MQRRFIRSAVVVAALVGLALPTGVQAGSPGPIDITSTARGQELATTGAARSTARGVRAAASDVRVWQLAPGEFLLGKALPANLRTSTVTAANGQTTIDVSYDVGTSLGALAPRSQAVQSAAAKSPSWLWLNQACFSRISNYYGWLDSCYVEHGMINESDPRDFYQLEQWGTLGAKQLIGKIYSGWVAGQQASGSAPMSWMDWSPRASKSGSCQGVPLSITVLGVGISASGLMCEQWNIYKYAAGGHFKEEWSCGCVYPLGQPYPQTREVDYMQAISIPGGGGPSWTLSAGFLAQ